MRMDENGSVNVGVIGVGSAQSWAREAHVAAVSAVPGLTLAAIATRDAATAGKTADELGAKRGYGDALELINDSDVSVVVVGVPVPAHRELILAALDAGKHVVTEWPVGTSTAETEELAAAASRSGLHTAVDLQARMSAAALAARGLVRSGAIGRVLTVTCYSTTAGFGRRISQRARKLENPDTGMNLTTIQVAHSLDFAVHVAGSLASVSALRTVRFPQVEIEDGDGKAPSVEHRVVPDHVLTHGRLTDGGAMALRVVGGLPANATPFRLDVEGELGSLSLRGGAPRGFQAGPLTLFRDDSPVDVSDAVARTDTQLPESAFNVAQVYAALRDDIRNGTTTAPSFDDALRLAHLIDDLVTSDSQQKVVRQSGAWPK